VAQWVTEEIAWYFRERTSYWLLGLRCNAVDAAPCVHTMIARLLLRFVKSSDLLDVKILSDWCILLSHVVQAHVFSQTKWMGRSKFERCLAACLAHFENLRRELAADEPMQCQSVCSLERSQLGSAVTRRAQHIVTAEVPQLFRRVHHSLHLRNPRNIFGGIWCPSNVLSCHESAMMAAEKLAYAELGLHFFSDLWAYWDGRIDEWTLVEDVLSSAGTVAAFTFGSTVMKLFIGGSAMDMVVRQVVLHTTEEKLCEVMAHASAAVVGKLVEHLAGTRESRALRCAYAYLGLSPRGMSEYSTARIESQLDFALRHGGNALELWSAYEFIRSRQHPDLRDPFRQPSRTNNSARGSGTPPSSAPDHGWTIVQSEDFATSLEILNLDPTCEHSWVTIRSRFLELCLLHHPDKPTGDHQMYLQLRAAYELLKRVEENAVAAQG